MSHDVTQYVKFVGYLFTSSALGAVAGVYLEKNSPTTGEKTIGLISGICSFICLGQAIKDGMDRQPDVK